MYIPVLGGKGGFGSMLRAIGAQIEKTTNREACRDLAGRRLRDVHTEKRIKDWINRQADRKKEQEERRLKKLQKLSSEPKVEFEDEEYFKTREQLPDQLEDAIEQGLKKASSFSVTPASEPTSSNLSCHTSEDDKSNDDAGNREVISSNNEASDVSHKRKDCPDTQKNPKNAKRTKTTLWTGIDEDELSSDEDDELPASN